MKLLTYNISFDYVDFELRMKAIIDIILNTKPDVVALQEVTPHSFNILKESSLSSTYNFSKEMFIVTYGCLILSKHPIIENKDIKFPNTLMGRSLSYITVKHNEQNYLFADIHLESEFARLAKKHNNKSDKEKVMHIISQIPHKIDQFKFMFEHLKQYNDHNIFIMGDTNITELENPLFKLPKDYTDIFTSLNFPSIISNNLYYTYDYVKNNRILGKFRSRLDRIYTNAKDIDKSVESFELVGCEFNVNQKCPSDHFGIMVTIN